MNQSNTTKSIQSTDGSSLFESAKWVLKELVSGGAAASVGIFVGNPFDVIKVRMQTMPETYTSASQCFNQIIKYEGPLGFYKGMSFPLYAQFFTGALSFGGNSIALSLLEPNLKESEMPIAWKSYAAGCFGGLCQCLVLVPTELIKCKLQVDHAFVKDHVSNQIYSGAVNCGLQVIKRDGIAGLFRGMASTTAREVPAFGLYFSSYEYMVSAAKQHPYISSTLTTILAGGTAGSLSWIVVYPFDVIKSHVQVHGNPEIDGPKSSGMIDVGRHLYRKYGYKIFFRGIGLTIMRGFPVNATIFLLYEEFNKILHHKF